MIVKDILHRIVRGGASPEKETMEYCFAHFNDQEYGEWYGYLRRDGAPTEPRAKGNVFKGPFHVPRMYCEVIRELEKLEQM